MTAFAIAGWTVALLEALLALYVDRRANGRAHFSASTITRLYADNCELRDKIGDREAVIVRQLHVIEAKKKELDYIGVRRNAKGRLESIKP